MTNIKITALTDIGNNIAPSTLVPVVDMAGTPTTKKSTLQNAGNLILSGAGGANFVPAARATLAQSVTNAAQPNITSVGTLTSLVVAGNVNLGTVANVSIAGGNPGQVLSTNGNGVLSWVNDANSSYGNGNVANYLPTFTGTVGATEISSSGNILVTTDSGLSWQFTDQGVLRWPGNIGQIDTNVDVFEIRSTNGLMISTDIGNANLSFDFGTDGVFTSPSNVNLLGSRLNVGPDAANTANLLNPTLVIANTGAQYIQAAIINNDGAGSSDWSADGAGGGDEEAWTDMGFAGFSFNDANFTVTEPGDGYLFVQGYANGLGGNMVLATGDHSNTADIIFATGGFLANAEFARIDHSANVFHLTRTGSGIKFQDGSIQTTAATGNIITVNLDGNVSNVLRGDGTFSADANSSYGDSNVASYLPSYGGNILVDTIIGNTTDNQGYVRWVGNSSGDNNGYTTIEVVPDDTLVANDQYLIIDPTEPSHIHIRAGGNVDNSQAELYLGGEINYVRVVDNSGVRLQNQTRNNTFYSFVDPTDFNTATWYESGGTNFVQYTAVDPQLGTLAFSFGDDDENRLVVTYGAGSTSTLTYGGSSSNLGGGVYRVSVVEAPPANPTSLTALEYEIWTTNTNNVVLANDDFTVYVEDDIRITGNDLFSLRNRSNTDPITIRTDYDNSDYVWEFSANGTLNTPGDIVVNGDVTGTAGGSTLVLRAESGSNTAIQLNDIVDSEIRTVANFEIRTDVSNTPRVWSFGTDGNLTLPGNTMAINFANGSSAFGNIVSVNLDGNVSNVLRGDGTFAADANSSYGDSNVVSLLGSFGSNTITTTGNVSVGNISGNGAGLSSLTGANVTGNVSAALLAYAVDGANVSGNVSAALVAYSVDLANVSGAGNIASVNLDGNVSNVLTGNGTFTTLPVIDANTVIWTTAPTANTDPGTAGQAAYDAGGNLYVCVSTNTWSKISGTTSW